MLLTFWLQRFTAVLVAGLLMLGGLEYLQSPQAIDLWSVAIWSFLAALTAATVSTYWSYRRGCAVRVDASAGADG